LDSRFSLHFRKKMKQMTILVCPRNGTYILYVPFVYTKAFKLQLWHSAYEVWPNIKYMKLTLFLEKIPVTVTQEFPNILWTWRFITMITRALQWSLFYARWIQLIPPILFLYFHFNIIFLPVFRSFMWSLCFAFPPKYYIYCTTCLALLTLLIIIVICGEWCKLWSTSVSSFLQPPVISSFLALCLHIPSVYVLPFMCETKFHISGKTTVLWIFMFTFLDSRWEDSKRALNWMVAIIMWMVSEERRLLGCYAMWLL
jgi:hypothetical protein